MRWITVRYADELPTLGGLDDTARTTVLDDAARVERYVRRNELIDDDDLRAYGERNDLPPDRLNTALAFLSEAGLLLTLDTAGPLTPPPPDADPPAE